MRDQSSCRRYAYQRMHKDGISKANGVVKACKPLYMDKLNQRYVADAVLRAKIVKDDHALFGGKKLWKKLLSKLITKGQWHQARDGELYSRGDVTKQGNPNIRVINTSEGYRLRVGLPGRGEFLFFKLYIPKKFHHEFELYHQCYDVRLKHKNEKFYVYIGLTIPDEKSVFRFSNGALGIDTNPDGLAIVETGRDGNLLGHQYLHADRLQFASRDKRKNDIEDLAKQVVDLAVLKGKGIVLEDLKFNDGKHGKKKFNRMRHNFVYSQLLQAIERRAVKNRVEVKKINPAFTSITGVLKYQEQYSLNRHTAAALVIARRGLGICERVQVKLEPGENKKLNLAGKGFKIALTAKAYAYFRHLYRVVEMKMPAVTPPCLSPGIGNYGTS